MCPLLLLPWELIGFCCRRLPCLIMPCKLHQQLRTRACVVLHHQCGCCCARAHKQEIQNNDVQRSVQHVRVLYLWQISLRLWWQLCRHMHNMRQQLRKRTIQVRLLRAQRWLLRLVRYMQPWLRANRLQLS